MPNAGYCAECESSVWLEPNGTCPEGHGRESITNVFEVAEPKVVRRGIPTGVFILAVVAVAVAMFVLGSSTGRRQGHLVGYDDGYAVGMAAGDKQGYARGNDEGFKSALDSIQTFNASLSDSLIRCDYPLKADTWMLIKLEKMTPGTALVDLAGWEVERQFSDIDDGEYQIDGDKLFTITNPYQDW